MTFLWLFPLLFSVLALRIAFYNRLSGMNFWLDTRDLIRLHRRTLQEWDTVWANNPVESDIIICLTTLPSRLNHIELTLKSLLHQQRRPQKIRLHIPDRSIRQKTTYEIPDYLHHLQGVDIVRCTDFGPATKLIPAVLDLPSHTRLLIVDDDRLYPSSFVETFHNYAQQHPDVAFGQAGWIVPADLTDRALTFWSNLYQTPPAPLKSTRIKQTIEVNILEGYAGYLVQPGFFDPDQLTDYTDAPPAAFFVDDVWVSAHCRAPRYVIPTQRQIFNPWRRRPFDQTALYRINDGNGKPEQRNNTIMIRYFRDHWQPLYPT